MRHRRHATIVSTAAALIVAWAGAARAEKVTLRWDGNTEVDLGGYQLHYAARSGPPYDGDFALEGKSPIDIPAAGIINRAQPEFTLSGLAPCSVVYLNLKAYNRAGLYSDFAEEISARVAHKPTRVRVSREGVDRVRVVWDAAPSAQRGAIASYQVYVDRQAPDPKTRAFRKPAKDVVSLDNPEAPSTVVEGVPLGTVVHVWVGAMCRTGESAISDAVSVALPAPEAHTALTSGCRVARDGSGGPSAWVVALVAAWLLLRWRASASRRERISGVNPEGAETRETRAS